MKKYKQHIANRMTNGRIKINGIKIKCVSSNVRPINIPWNSLRIITGIPMFNSLNPTEVKSIVEQILGK